MALFLIIHIGLSLDDLDPFGSLDELPRSLDDRFWAEAANIRLSGNSASPSRARALGRKVFYGGPRRSVSPGAARGAGRFRGHGWITRAV